MRKHKTLSALLYLLGLLFSVAPPAVATLFYFPVWQRAGGVHMLSGIVILLLLLSALPLAKLIAHMLRSPSVIFIWGAIYLLFLALSAIADQVTVIAFYGLLGNIAGAVCFKISRRLRGKNEELPRA